MENEKTAEQVKAEYKAAKNKELLTYVMVGFAVFGAIALFSKLSS